MQEKQEWDKGWMLLLQAIMRRRSAEWFTDPRIHGGKYVPDAQTLVNRLSAARATRDCRRWVGRCSSTAAGGWVAAVGLPQVDRCVQLTDTYSWVMRRPFPLSAGRTPRLLLLSWCDRASRTLAFKRCPESLLPAQVRGEGRYIQEWLTWHLFVGYSHIVVFYEDPDDGTLDGACSSSLPGVLGTAETPHCPAFLSSSDRALRRRGACHCYSHAKCTGRTRVNGRL